MYSNLSLIFSRQNTHFYALVPHDTWFVSKKGSFLLQNNLIRRNAENYSTRKKWNYLNSII